METVLLYILYLTTLGNTITKKYNYEVKKMNYIKNIFKGLLISISTLVPGVSGGTMAIVLGVYDDLIHAISSFFEDWRKHTKLLLQLGIGAIIGVLLFSKLIETALIKIPDIMSFFFIGVICGGIPILYKRATKTDNNKINLVFLFVGLIIASFMSKPGAVTTLATSGGSTGAIFLFIAGFIIAVALILPGISGSFMLLILGLYDITLKAINTFNIPYLIPIGLGAIIGTLATTKAIEKLLQKYPGKTYMLILGFVAGSIPAIFKGFPSGGTLVFSLIASCIGFILIYLMGKFEF